MHRWHPAAGSGTAAGTGAATVAPSGIILMLYFTLHMTTFTGCAVAQYNGKLKKKTKPFQLPML